MCPDVPVFGLMTKLDLAQTPSGVKEQHQREKEFIDCLGLHGSKHRFARCRNYCDETAPDRIFNSYPQIDLDILKFLYIVLDPAYEPQNEDKYQNERSLSMPSGEVTPTGYLSMTQNGSLRTRRTKSSSHPPSGDKVRSRSQRWLVGWCSARTALVCVLCYLVLCVCLVGSPLDGSSTGMAVSWLLLFLPVFLLIYYLQIFSLERE